jgi:hypothetical protein
MKPDKTVDFTGDVDPRRGRADGELSQHDAPEDGNRVIWYVAAAALVVVLVTAGLWLAAGRPGASGGDTEPPVAASEGAGSPDRTSAGADAPQPSQPPPAEMSRPEGVPVPPQNASPEEIAVYEQRLAERIAASREGAQRGDLLDEELVGYLERTTRQLLEGEGGEDLLATLRESNPGYELEEGEVRPELAINAPYPEDAPLSTVPPRLLQVYPILPEGFEYRFVGCRVVVLERDARLILDYSDRCLW